MVKKAEESKYLRWVVNLWTVITFVAIIMDFRSPERLEGILGPVLAIYTAALAMYSAEKEFERWNLYFIGRHPGEVYVIAWSSLILALFVSKFLTHSDYKMNPEIIATYIVVVGILAITQKSKTYFKERRRKKNQEETAEEL